MKYKTLVAISFISLFLYGCPSERVMYLSKIELAKNEGVEKLVKGFKTNLNVDDYYSGASKYCRGIGGDYGNIFICSKDKHVRVFSFYHQRGFDLSKGLEAFRKHERRKEEVDMIKTHEDIEKSITSNFNVKSSRSIHESSEVESIIKEYGN